MSTPIERYYIKRRRVWVKRDDLFCKTPPVAKTRGLRRLLKRLVREKCGLVGCFQSRVSDVGHAVAVVAREFPGIEVLVGVVGGPGGGVSSATTHARALGAEVVLLKPNVGNVCHAQISRIVQRRNGFMIPFGFEFREAVEGVEHEARSVDEKLSAGGTVVLCCGSGVTLAGLLRGLPGRPRKVLAVSCGRTEKRIAACVARHATWDKQLIEFVPPIMPYAIPCDCPCPFPCNRFYDRKAWRVLTERMSELTQPVLFWNVGG
jgi:1-aminocyclopropane-1-carboxylate deaminase/D-cysteine desulfhydrase-like pyridoxal-dependent ACC family enzyme